tara:strand:- start:1183 stop:2127 length:945 start_codon:yes stop_codon:yes gene_type:complete
MAINVNTVYQTVLLILNKEQRGYMTPVEFNKTGAQAQLEIFETYFDSLNQQIRIPQTDTDFSDRVLNLDEKISLFKEFGNATSISSSNVFNLPQQFSGSGSIATTTLPAATAGATTAYVIQTATASQIANGVVEIFANGVLVADNLYEISGTTINFFSQPTVGETLIVNVYPKEFYRLGDLFYTAGAIPTQELERVGTKDLYHLLSSNLTSPTTTYPIYTYKNNKITVYPNSITSGITVSYIRKPIAPIWNFTTGLNNQYVFNASTSFNFELHPAEQTELILKILLYAGVVIRSPEIVQVAAQQVAQENINQQR